jgi:hypothetical protein
VLGTPAGRLYPIGNEAERGAGWVGQVAQPLRGSDIQRALDSNPPAVGPDLTSYSAATVGAEEVKVYDDALAIGVRSARRAAAHPVDVTSATSRRASAVYEGTRSITRESLSPISSIGPPSRFSRNSRVSRA